MVVSTTRLCFFDARWICTGDSANALATAQAGEHSTGLCEEDRDRVVTPGSGGATTVIRKIATIAGYRQNDTHTRQRTNYVLYYFFCVMSCSGEGTVNCLITRPGGTPRTRGLAWLGRAE